MTRGGALEAWLCAAIALIPASASAAESFTDPLADGGRGPAMVVVPRGDLHMGSPSDEAGRDADEGPRTAVRIASFALAVTEVTVAEFRGFVEATGYQTDAERVGGCYAWNRELEMAEGMHWANLSGYRDSDAHPVRCVSANDAERYAEWLSAQTGHRYRLPTEAEWEYAARGGSETARYWGDDPDAACAFANVSDRSTLARFPDLAAHHDCDDGYPEAAPVGQFEPNGFGLHDVLGNVWEWTCSAMEVPLGEAARVCATGPGPRDRRVFRGGAWYISPPGVRSAHRNAGRHYQRTVSIGFRVARDL